MQFSTQNMRWLITALLSILLSLMAYLVFYTSNIEQEQTQFQEDFNALEHQQLDFAEQLKIELEEEGFEKVWWNQDLQNIPYLISIFEKDSLLFWNNNIINIQNETSEDNAHFIRRFANGYYLVDQIKIEDKQIFIASLIKNMFYYQNDILENNLSEHFRTSNKVRFQWEQKEDNFAVKSVEGNTLFYLHIFNEKQTQPYQETIIFLLYCFGLASLLIGISLQIKVFSDKYPLLFVVYPVALLLLRYFSITLNWITLFDDFELSSPALYASSTLFPNFGSLFITLLVWGVVIWWIIIAIRQLISKKKTFLFVLIILYIGLLMYALWIDFIFVSLIVNSAIPLVIEKMFSLNIYSIIALIIISSLFLSYYFLIRNITISFVRIEWSIAKVIVFYILTSCVFFGIGYFIFHITIYSLCWPIVLNGLFFYLAFHPLLKNTVRYHLLIVIFFGLYGAFILYQNNLSNEHQKRELYANQLITDQDPTMEIEFEETIDKLVNNPEFYQLIKEADFFTGPDFTLQIENCCFGSFWERYEMSFYFFDENGFPLIDYLSYDNEPIEDIQNAIAHHSSPSSIANGLYFITDYYKQLSYVGHQKIKNEEGADLDFFILFRSKKIPEKIGFPRLLMNERSYALQHLENYSIARYSDEKLVMKFGEHNYPSSSKVYQRNGEIVSGFMDWKGMSHYVYRQDDGQMIIISTPEKRFIDQLSVFSYLIVVFGVYALIILMIARRKSIFNVTNFHLSLKVQTVLIGMVTGAFVILTVVAIRNVRHQYEVYTQQNLNDKLNGVTNQIDETIGSRKTLNIEENSDYMNYVLKKISSIYWTDINFYTPKGELLATSQPKLYEKGIAAPQINSRAFFALHHQKMSEFMHYEQLGELRFLSGYLPYINRDGELMGYVNLQHFTQQNTFENQLNDFIVAVINLAVLFMVITVIITILVSRWITSPLRLIQESFKNVQFGKKNQPIDYEGNDEIGALVNDYNNKLIELEVTALQLAKSERESAWREMAKQVAHEIKNPLTPMKLSVQHFQRSFDPSDENAKEKIKKITNSLISQIDALTKIANEFSHFAKLPKPNEEKLDLSDILSEIKNIYENENVHISFEEESDDNWIMADKNLIIRVFNNLIKNAIQAKKDNKKMEIEISIENTEQHYIVCVSDNGTGIPEEIQHKMFVPNFTTKSTGSGLGLAMVKQIIDQHNGKIWFETEAEKGTRFFVQLLKA